MYIYIFLCYNITAYKKHFSVLMLYLTYNDHFNENTLATILLRCFFSFSLNTLQLLLFRKVNSATFSDLKYCYRTKDQENKEFFNDSAVSFMSQHIKPGINSNGQVSGIKLSKINYILYLSAYKSSRLKSNCVTQGTNLLTTVF